VVVVVVPAAALLLLLLILSSRNHRLWKTAVQKYNDTTDDQNLTAVRMKASNLLLKLISCVE
jgi:hypothetical protein